MNTAHAIGEICRKVQRSFSALKLAAYDFCYAGACCVCGQPVVDEREHPSERPSAHSSDASDAASSASGMLCRACVKSLAQLEKYPHCRRCAASLPYAGAPCEHCRGKGLPLLKRVVALGPFAEPLTQLVYRFKYDQRWALGEELTDRLRLTGRAVSLLCDCQVIVPVPLHHWRQVHRGFNQADVIAQRLSRHCGLPVAQAVARRRPTQTQTHLHSRRQREENLRDAFGIRSAKAVAGKHVLLIDDVMTTGATLQSIARVLKSARPASISAMVLAVADARYQKKPQTSQISQTAPVEPVVA